jgi:hypothetical protein
MHRTGGKGRFGMGRSEHDARREFNGAGRFLRT